MPVDGPLYDYGRREAARRKAWEAHYQAKGCGELKAWGLARRKCARKATWPPGRHP